MTPGWINHGTAVLGEMVAPPPNSKGAVGISHQAKAVVQSAVVNNSLQHRRCDHER